jgi:hypothetical protein
MNLQCQTNNESTLVPGNLTRVKQRGATAGYGNSEEVTGVYSALRREDGFRSNESYIWA